MSYFVRRLKLNNFIIIFHCSQQTTFSAIQGIIECNTLFSSDSFLPIRFLFYFGNTVMFQLFAALWITRALVALLVLLLDTSQPNERQQYAVQCIFSPPVEHNGASCFLFHFILVIFYQMCYALQGNFYHKFNTKLLHYKIPSLLRSLRISQLSLEGAVRGLPYLPRQQPVLFINRWHPRTRTTFSIYYH